MKIEDKYLNVSAEDGEILVGLTVYGTRENGSKGAINLSYDISVDEARDLIRMLETAIDMVESDEV